MSNMLVSLDFTLDLPAEAIEKITGRPDDGSDSWYAESGEKVRAAVEDEPSRFMEYVTDTEVEVHA